MIELPRLYPIIDAGILQSRELDLRSFSVELRQAGITLAQWRHKDGSPQEILTGAAIIRQTFAATNCRLIMNDRADLAALAGFNGIHVGQGDLSPQDARHVLGPDHWVGVSTHSDQQVEIADRSTADYIAIGPIFATGTKLDAAPVVGLEGVRRARALTSKPIVAIGGITRENARSVIDAGADSVAVISALLAAGESVERVAGDFLALLR
jgi:thiamine-phosphate pyrophosphorylase